MFKYFAGYSILSPESCKILFIGEGPDKTEDLRAKPFIGPAGKILDAGIVKATKLAGLSYPPSYYITNTVQCRPCDDINGKNRQPKPEEVRACWHNLEAVYSAVRPHRIILLGKVAKQYCLKAWPDALCVVHPQYLGYRGGVESPEFLAFARGISEVFKEVSCTQK
jgi:uracil-DNA glycosylase family 4